MEGLVRHTERRHHGQHVSSSFFSDAQCGMWMGRNKPTRGRQDKRLFITLVWGRGAERDRFWSYLRGKSTGLLSVVGKGREESRMTPRFLNGASQWTVLLTRGAGGVSRTFRWVRLAGFACLELRWLVWARSRVWELLISVADEGRERGNDSGRTHGDESWGRWRPDGSGPQG